MQTLWYWYPVNSTLPQRTFIVNVEHPLSGEPDGDESVFQVIAPDDVMAQEVVRKRLVRSNDVITFWTYAIREIVQDYRGAVYQRPFMLRGQTVRFPYERA